MKNKYLIVTCLAILSFAVTVSCIRCQDKHQDSTTFYRDLFSSLTGKSIAFPPEPANIPGEVNGTVLFFQDNPCDLADFAVNKARELSELSVTMEVLHRLHILNSLSAGGYGPPVSGTGRWKQGYNQSEDNIENLQRFMADPGEGGVGLRIHPNTLPVLKRMDPEAVQLVVDLLDLTSVLLRISACFTDPDVLAELKNPYPAFTAPGTADLLMIPFRDREVYSNLHRRLFNSVDKEMIAFGSRIMVEEVNSIAGRYRELNQKGRILLDKPLVLETAYGLIQLLTDSQDTVRLPSLISLDPGGDDFYAAGVAASEAYTHPVGICIDLGGNDKYGSDDAENAVCSSACGLSYLLDLQGDDTYWSGSGGLAFAIVGCSVLDDRSGDDTYTCNGNYGIAASFFGQALLIDYKGNDEYRAGSYSSGFGGTGGVALLLDFEGDDSYLSPAASFSQGTSSGRWADATDGFSMGGGVGMLVDCRGNDEYSAAWFSQGASYYYGFGLLADMEGDDRYNSISHSQGSAVHTSLALFSDLSGNDIYNLNTDSSRITQSIGYGRDRSSAFFIDQSGDDRYCFGNKSFGVGDIQSLGFAVDFSGDDSYTWYNNPVYKESGSFGSSQALDKAMDIQPGSVWSHGRWCAGIAYDMKGDDRYLFFSESPEPARFFRDRKTDKKITESTYSLRRDR